MLKLYGQYRSRAFRVAWLCKESDIAFEHVDTTTTGDAPGCKEPRYVALNPNARVPTIDDDGFVMWESAAINMYLAEKYRSPLWPATLQGRGNALQWSFFIANDVEPPMIQMFQHRVVFPPEKRDPKLAADGEQRMLARLPILEGQLAKTRFFGGDKWDLSDFMAASVLYTLAVIKYDLAKFPKLQAWLAASIERPGAKQARKLRE